jgi:Domain of unknown function (DUF4384)
MIRATGLWAPLLALAILPAAFTQSRTMTQGPHRMEIMLERHAKDGWKTIDPGLVLAQGDRVRFRFRTNFDGYLYVTNQNSSGAYQQLFPLAETGQDNRVTANRETQVPTTSMVFRIDGPAGYETVYWLVTPSRLAEGKTSAAPTPEHKMLPSNSGVNPGANPGALVPRCDDSIWRARGDCIDNSAGPKLVPRGEQLPEALSGANDKTSRDLFFMRQNDKSVISSPAPLAGPVIYEFRLAHK